MSNKYKINFNSNKLLIQARDEIQGSGEIQDASTVLVVDLLKGLDIVLH